MSVIAVQTFEPRVLRGAGKAAAIDLRVALTATTTAAMFAGTLRTRLQIDWLSFWPIMAGAAALLMISVFYTFHRTDRNIQETTFTVVLMLLFSNAAEMLNYLALDLRRPVVDLQLHALDESLGLDWWTYTATLKSQPLLARALSLAYQSAVPQIIIATLFLGLSGRIDQLRRMSLAFMICVLAAIGFWAIYPTFGVLSLLYSQGAAPPSLNLVCEVRCARELLNLAAGRIPVLSPATLNGIIGCPSIHAVWAVLMIYSFHRSRWLCIPALAVNGLMLLSTPTDGSHHFVDVFAGLALALVALALVTGCTPLASALRVRNARQAAFANVSRPR